MSLRESEAVQVSLPDLGLAPVAVHSVPRVAAHALSLLLRVRQIPREQKTPIQLSLLRHQIPARTYKLSSRLDWLDARPTRHGREIVRFRHLPPRPRLARPRLLAQQLGQRQGETRHRRTEKDPRRHRQGPRYQLCLVGRRLLQRRQQGRINSGPSLSSHRLFSCARLTRLHTQPEQRRTATGILSHRPPPPKANAYDESPQTQSSGLNLDAMAAVKLEQARRQLYSGFLRGSVISGSKDEEEDQEAATSSKGKKRSREEDEDEDEDEEASPVASSKAERKAARAAKKEAKAQRKLDKEARRAAKKKKGKSAVGGESSTGDDLSSTSANASASASRATSVDSNLSSSSTLTVAPSLREKALRRQRKQKTTTTGAETLSSAGSTTSTPLPSEAEATDVDDELARARKAIRRAAKEERRAARAVVAAAAAGTV